MLTTLQTGFGPHWHSVEIPRDGICKRFLDLEYRHYSDLGDFWKLSLAFLFLPELDYARLAVSS